MKPDTQSLSRLEEIYGPCTCEIYGVCVLCAALHDLEQPGSTTSNVTATGPWSAYVTDESDADPGV